MNKNSNVDVHGTVTFLQMEMNTLKDMVLGKPAPLVSTFRLSYYSILNLMSRAEGQFTAEHVIKNSFHQFQYEKVSDAPIYFFSLAIVPHSGLTWSVALFFRPCLTLGKRFQSWKRKLLSLKLQERLIDVCLLCFSFLDVYMYCWIVSACLGWSGRISQAEVRNSSTWEEDDGRDNQAWESPLLPSSWPTGRWLRCLFDQLLS